MNKIYSKLIGFIFGRCAPAQLMVVSILGCIFGFIPNFSASPLLYVIVIVLVIVLRVSMGLFAVISLIYYAHSIFASTICVWYWCMVCQ